MLDEGTRTEGEIDERDASDAIAFVLGGGTASARRDPRPPVLEVFHLWGNAVLDARRFTDASRPVVLGADTGHRWRFLGVDMGWVPAPISALLPAMAPMWSDVSREWRSDFVVPTSDLPDEEAWALFVPGLAGPVARLAPGWGAWALVAGEKRSLAELVADGRAAASPDGAVEVTMAPDLRLVIEAAGARFVAQMGPSPAGLVDREDTVDPGFLAMLGAGGFLFALIAALVRLAPPAQSTEVEEMPDRLVELLLDRPVPKPPSVVSEGSAERGERAKGDEGRSGRPDAKRAEAKGEPRQTRRQEMDRQVAERAGVLGAFADDGYDAVIGPTGMSDLSDAIGGTRGERGTRLGSDGLADRGDGFGGGGEAETLGGLSTLPGGDGRGEWGSEGGDLGDKVEGGVAGPAGDSIVLGALDRSLIDEVIKRHLQAIRYCYQRELSRDPSLGGDIAIRFTIARDGTVSTAEVKSSSLRSPPVETCVAGRFMSMQFPAPRGGGLVIVTSAFDFHAN